jgi:hypothetical protein
MRGSAVVNAPAICLAPTFALPKMNTAVRAESIAITSSGLLRMALSFVSTTQPFAPTSVIQTASAAFGA